MEFVSVDGGFLVDSESPPGMTFVYCNAISRMVHGT